MPCCSNNSDAKTASNSSQRWLIFVLFVWLLFSIARQTFDLIGKLWIPIAFNLVQALTCILGFFAAFQCHFCLLIVLTILTLFLISYNVAIILWYSDFFGSGLRESDALSAGLPFGHSFFLRYTPFCDGAAYFNLTAVRWQQHKDQCFLPYNEIERFQAGAHVVLALTTLIFSIWTLIKRKEILSNYRQKSDSQLPPTLSYGIMGESMRVKRNTNASINKKKRTSMKGRRTDGGVVIPASNNTTLGNKAPRKLIVNGIELTPPDSIDDLSSGYMNSSYESTAIASGEFRPQSQQNLLYKKLKQQQQQQLQQQQQQQLTLTNQSSFKNHSTFQQQQQQNSILRRSNFKKNDSLTTADLPEKVRNTRNLDEYSSATTAEINGVHHSTSNSTSSAFDAATNSTALPDLPLPPPPFPSSFRPQSANSQKYFEHGSMDNCVSNQNADYNGINNNANTYEDSDNDSTKYSQIGVPETLPGFKGQKRQQSKPNFHNRNQSGAYSSTRMYASRNNSVGQFNSGGSSRYYSAKARNTGTTGSRSTLNIDSNDDPNSFCYSKLNRVTNEKRDSISRPNSSLADTTCHQRANSGTPATEVASTDNNGYLEFMSRNPSNSRRSSSTNLTSLISFDPKSNTLIRVRKHQNSESEEESTINTSETEFKYRRPSLSNFSLHNEHETIETVHNLEPKRSNSNCNSTINNSAVNVSMNSTQRSESQDSVPSIKAPVLSSNIRSQIGQHDSNSFQTENANNSRSIRRKMIPFHTDSSNLTNGSLHQNYQPLESRGKQFNDISETESFENGEQLKSKGPVPFVPSQGNCTMEQQQNFPKRVGESRFGLQLDSQLHFQSNENSDNFMTGCGNIEDNDYGIKMAPLTPNFNPFDATMSIYDCFGGQRPLSATAFPVSNNGQQRSMAGISVASAINLTNGNNFCAQNTSTGTQLSMKNGISDKFPIYNLNGEKNSFGQNHYAATSLLHNGDGRNDYSKMMSNRSNSNLPSNFLCGKNVSPSKDKLNGMLV